MAIADVLAIYGEADVAALADLYVRLADAPLRDMPASVGADLNGDGMADAYWDHNLTLRRMDAANRVDNPTYRHSWNWGGLIYWGVREGQGQIGWPGGQ